MAPSLSRTIRPLALLLGAIGLGSIASSPVTPLAATTQEATVRSVSVPSSSRSMPVSVGQRITRAPLGIRDMGARERFQFYSPIWTGRPRPRSHH